MTLVSHAYEFIFLKTFKTASTSVEGVLERYCQPEGDAALLEMQRPGQITEAGIIAARSKAFHTDSPWRGHMSAATVRDLLGPDIWSRYRIVHTTRNVYARFVSYFGATNGDLMGRDVSRAQRIEAFRAWLPGSAQNTLDCHDVYMIDGVPASDTYIRFDHMAEDLTAFATERGLPDFDLSTLPHWRDRKKRRVRLGDPREYYDRASLAYLEDRYAWEIDHFGWTLEDATLAAPEPPKHPEMTAEKDASHGRID